MGEANTTVRVCLTEGCNKKVKRKYCSRKCSDRNYYLKNKEQVVARINRWRLKNPEKVKELIRENNKKYYLNNREKHHEAMRKQYHKNKELWNSRSSVYNIVNGKGGYVEYPIPNSTCKVCGSTKKLRIHCEGIYRYKRNVVEAINKEKIYYLCSLH